MIHPVETQIKVGYYRHFKNQDIYRVFGTVKDSESLLTYVLYGKQVPTWVRPLENFTSSVWNANAIVPRFEFLGETGTYLIKDSVFKKMHRRADDEAAYCLGWDD